MPCKEEAKSVIHSKLSVFALQQDYYGGPKMEKFDGVANTLFVPLVARINISKSFPEYFYDPKSLELEPLLPNDANKGASE